jgi:hypothetical protein
MSPSDYDSFQTVDHHRRHEFAQIEEYSRRELPRLVQRELELRVERSFFPMEEQLRSELVDIVRDCLTEIFRSYQQGNRSSQASIHSTETSAGTARSLTPSSDSYILEGPALFDLSSPNSSPPLIVSTPQVLAPFVEPQTNHTVPHQATSYSMSISGHVQPVHLTSPDYTWHQTSVDHSQTLAPLSIETHLDFTSGLDPNSDIFDTWHGNPPSFETMATDSNNLLPAMVAQSFLPRSQYAKGFDRRKA